MDNDVLPNTATSETDAVRLNGDAAWETFTSEVYFKQNYAALREDDKEIIRTMGKYLAEHFKGHPSTTRRAIDVGTGVNLYPALAMLPFCGSITLYEYAPTNLEWLRREKGLAWANSWKVPAPHFWAVLEDLPPYGAVDAPLQQLTDRIDIQQGSLFELRSDQPWDLGTMFFVAESITEDPDQFRQGIDRFLSALRVGAPFVIAFMEGRENGYHVAGQSFPSTDIYESDVRQYLSAKTHLDVVKHIPHEVEAPLDDPYTGMVVACGRTRASASHNPA